MIRHQADGQHRDAILPRQDTVVGKVHQVVHEVVEENAAIGRSLIAVKEGVF